MHPWPSCNGRTRNALSMSMSIGKYLGRVKIFPLGGEQRAQSQEPDLHRIFAFQCDI